jgi:hypothetical protein
VIDFVHALSGALAGFILIAIGSFPEQLQGIADGLANFAGCFVLRFAPRVKVDPYRPRWWLIALGTVFIAATFVAFLWK